MSSTLFDVTIGYVVAAFLALAGLDHLLTATLGRRIYERDLGRDQPVPVGRTPWVAMGINIPLCSDAPRYIFVILVIQGIFFFCFSSLDHGQRAEPFGLDLARAHQVIMVEPRDGVELSTRDEVRFVRSPTARRP